MLPDTIPLNRLLARIAPVALFALCVTAAGTAMAADAPDGAATARAVPRPAPGPAGPGIVWRGDIVSARGFVNDLVDAFGKEQPGRLTVQPFSTISGIDAVIDGSADIAGSARAMHEKREAERQLIFQPVALDAIVPVTHPRNPVNNVTLAQLRQIYLGRITNWKDAGGADAPINLYSIAAPLDGVEYSFRRLLYRHGDQRIAAPRLYLNTGKLEEAIAIDPNGLGLSTLSNAYANKGMKMLSVEGIAATTQSIANGSYPLFNTLYVVQREDAANRPAIDGFVRFLGSPNALQVMRRHQLVPWSEAGDVYSRDGARLAFIDAAILEVTPADVAAMPRAREIPPPMSAPRAVLESSIAIAPASETAQKARENLSRAEEKKGERATEAKPDSKSN